MSKRKSSPSGLAYKLSSDEAVVKSMLYIQRAGFWAVAVGMILTLWCAVLINLAPTAPLTYAYMIIAAYLIVAGWRLNKLADGNGIVALLWINLILGLILMRGIFPLLMLIMSIIALTKVKLFLRWFRANEGRYHDVMGIEGKKIDKPWIITSIVLGAILFIAVAISMVTHIMSRGDFRGTQSTLGSMEADQPFVGSEHAFTINFPNTPTIEHDSTQYEDMEIPLTLYTEFFDNDSKGYMLQVGEYAKDRMVAGNERGVIDGAINGTAQTEGFSLVSSANDGFIEGYPSGSAYYRYTQSGQVYDTYVTNILRDNKLYTLMTIGLDKAYFDQFAKSLKFN